MIPWFLSPLNSFHLNSLVSIVTVEQSWEQMWCFIFFSSLTQSSHHLLNADWRLMRWLAASTEQLIQFRCRKIFTLTVSRERYMKKVNIRNLLESSVHSTVACCRYKEEKKKAIRCETVIVSYYFTRTRVEYNRKVKKKWVQLFFFSLSLSIASVLVIYMWNVFSTHRNSETLHTHLTVQGQRRYRGRRKSNS